MKCLSSMLFASIPGQLKGLIKLSNGPGEALSHIRSLETRHRSNKVLEDGLGEGSSNFQEHATGISEREKLWIAHPAWEGLWS